MQTISFFYDDHRKVKKVLSDLAVLGVAPAATSLVARDADEPYRYRNVVERSEVDEAFGAIFGGVIGIVFGAFLVTGTFEIPGFGVLVSTGEILTFLTTGSVGALGGWIIGYFIRHLTLHSRSADTGTLLSVRANDDEALAVEEIMRKGYSSEPSDRIDAVKLSGGHGSSWRHETMADHFDHSHSNRRSINT